MALRSLVSEKKTMTRNSDGSTWTNPWRLPYFPSRKRLTIE